MGGGAFRVNDVTRSEGKCHVNHRNPGYLHSSYIYVIPSQIFGNLSWQKMESIATLIHIHVIYKSQHTVISSYGKLRWEGGSRCAWSSGLVQRTQNTVLWLARSPCPSSPWSAPPPPAATRSSAATRNSRMPAMRGKSKEATYLYLSLV